MTNKEKAEFTYKELQNRKKARERDVEFHIFDNMERIRKRKRHV